MRMACGVFHLCLYRWSLWVVAYVLAIIIVCLLLIEHFKPLITAVYLMPSYVFVVLTTQLPCIVIIIIMVSIWKVYYWISMKIWGIIFIPYFYNYFVIREYSMVRHYVLKNILIHFFIGTYDGSYIMLRHMD